MSLVFNAFEITAIGLSVLAIAIVSLDGESNWLEGLQLLGVYCDPCARLLPDSGVISCQLSAVSYQLLNIAQSSCSRLGHSLSRICALFSLFHLGRWRLRSFFSSDCAARHL